MTHHPEAHDPPWTTGEDAAGARRREEITEEAPYVGRHGIRHPQEGLGIGSAPLDDPFGDSAQGGATPQGSGGEHDCAGQHDGTAAAPGHRPARRFNQPEPREGPAWADQPDGGAVLRRGTDADSEAGAPARHQASPAMDVPVEEITPEDLPEVGEPYAQPGAPFEVQGPDRP